GILRGDRIHASGPRSISGEDQTGLPELPAPLRVQRDLLRATLAGRSESRLTDEGMAPRKSDLHLHRAFDTVRFGASNILNLREGLPSVVEATRRAESWIRQRQVEGASEVLLITGRGKGSEGGISPVREAIVRLIASLRRRGIL